MTFLPGDATTILRTLPADSVHCVVTSPPYYGLRDYGTAQWDGGDAACDHVDMQGGTRRDVSPERLAQRAALYGAGTGSGSAVQASQYRDTCGKCGAKRIDQQLGLEATPDQYLDNMVAVFREVRRVLRPDGTCWLNIGDSYAASRGGSDMPAQTVHGGGTNGADNLETRRGKGEGYRANRDPAAHGLKHKDLLMMPARLALALQRDGWYIRADIIWHKPNPMPESVTDRPTSAHEHIYLLTKSPRYYYDADAVREANSNPDLSECAKDWRQRPNNGERPSGTGGRMGSVSAGRNCRNVWTIATEAFPEAHFATFPTKLAERCIKAGSRPGDTVLDPFGGAGTVALVATHLARKHISIELNPEYVAMAEKRINAPIDLFHKTDLLAAFDVFATTRPDLTDPEALQLAYRAYSLDLAHPKFAVRHTRKARRTTPPQATQLDMFAESL